MRRAVLLGGAVAGVLLAVVLVWLGGRDSAAGGEVAVEVTGRAAITENGGSRTVASGRYRLAEGSTVEVVEGVAVATMPDGARLELRAGFGGAVDSRAQLHRPVVLLAGDLLAEAGSEAVQVEAAGTLVRIEGAGRVSRFAAVTAGLYEGGGGVESVDRRLEVPALRQAVVPDLGLVPARPEPFVYDEQDPWDRRFLGAAMRLSDELEARSRGFSAQLAAEGRAALGDHVVRLTAAGPAATPPDLLDGDRPPGETIVGAAIAGEASDGDLAETWTSVFGFRDEGAAWGLVALDQGVERESLLARLDGVIAEAPLLFAAPGTPASERTSPPTTTTTEPESPPPPPPAPPPGPGSPPDPPDDEPPAPTDPVLDPVEGVVDEVTDLLGGLLGGGDSVEDDPGLLDRGGLLDDVPDAVGGLLGGAGAAADGLLSGAPGGR